MIDNEDRNGPVIVIGTDPGICETVYVLTAIGLSGAPAMIGVFRYLDTAKSAAELISGGLLVWGPGALDGQTHAEAAPGQTIVKHPLAGGAVYTIDTTVVIW